MALLLSATVRAAVPATTDFEDYRGRLGTLPIGMTLAIRDGHVLPGSHYFYDSHLADIPLAGRAGPDLTMTEPGGGVFDLRFVDARQSPVADPHQATGLQGVWRQGTRSLPVVLRDEGGGSFVPGHRYADVTDESDAAFEARVRGFTTAALAGRRAEAMRFVAFPLRVNRAAGRAQTIPDAATLLARWDRVFTPAWLKALSADVPHDLFVHDGQAMMANGLAWFGPDGLAAVNPAR
ncbi:hypothetical protein FHR90_000880 [Endobacter medicaginis]|uniref:Uncharacterized protein n=1 Tax=Endobacter medicaginis TaxID=1181271 RepID=A0A850NTF2_9PROT|nr:hypothetical protein [Endobacter medicaginis]MBB3173062.1 hypothetical protein [Endobacter medicaginis]MCX5474513.1 hypothetical protein [Endobacter medicaginis]NVN31066.1 hypothetical protein [Endobacter medicaginis]